MAKALPEGWEVYVKEHPVEWDVRGLNYTAYRYPGYYKRIATVKNVKIVPIDTNTFSLVRESKAVASVTGTPVWEAIVRLKPGIIFGHPWYQNCPSIFRVDSVDSARMAFEKITNGYRVESWRVINFLKCLEESAIKYYFDSAEKVKPHLSLKESAECSMKAILEEIISTKNNK